MNVTVKVLTTEMHLCCVLMVRSNWAGIACESLLSSGYPPEMFVAVRCLGHCSDSLSQSESV